MKKILLLIVSMLFLGFGCVNQAVAADQDPVAMLQSVADRLIAGLKENKATLKKNPGVVYALASKIVVPHADLLEMSKRVLPPRIWDGATQAQRDQFQKEFTTLLVRTYASALAEYKDQSIRFYPVRGGYEGKSAVKVDSQIVRTDGPSISVSYRLLLRGTDWKLYDLIVEGVSLLESFRSQFAEKVTKGNMQDLLVDLKQHNTENSGE